MSANRTDTDLLACAVNLATSHRRLPRWAVVMALLGLGSTSANELCIRFGVDPDEIVDGCPDCEERNEEAFLADCAARCSCCEECNGPGLPCAGVQQGAPCDGLCTCPADEDEDEYDERRRLGAP